MTVKQMEKEFVISVDNEKHFIRLKINREFSRQLIEHFLKESSQNMSKEEKLKIFNKGVQIVNNRFWNLYGSASNTEWLMFYASVIVPIKIGLGLTIPKMNDDSMVNKYKNEIALTKEEKEAILNCGVCRLSLTSAGLKRHLTAFCLPIEEPDIFRFAEKEYFDGKLDENKKDYVYETICDLHNHFVDNSEIIERVLKENGGVITIKKAE